MKNINIFWQSTNNRCCAHCMPLL